MLPTSLAQLQPALGLVQLAQVLADLFEVALDAFQLQAALVVQQQPYFPLQFAAELIELGLALIALFFQTLPLTGLRQTIAFVIQQLGGTAQVTAVGEDLLQRTIGFGQARITALAPTEVAVLQFFLGQQLLLAQCGLFHQQHGCAGP